MKTWLKFCVVFVIVVVVLLCVYFMGKNQTIESPYNYEVNCTVSELKDMGKSELRELYVLPKEVTDKMTTDAFVESLLDNRYFSKLVVRDVSSADIVWLPDVIADKDLHLEDLRKREDFEEVIYAKEKELKDKYGVDSILHIYASPDHVEDKDFDNMCRMYNLFWLIQVAEYDESKWK